MRLMTNKFGFLKSKKKNITEKKLINGAQYYYNTLRHL